MNKPSWKIRRRLINLTLSFCAFCVLWIMFRGDDRGVMDTIVMASFGMAFAVLGSYIFGAAWDDKNVMRFLGRRAYQDEPPRPVDQVDGPQS